MRRAIALGGGGTKGAYEAGVWKALLELGIEYEIVTGTSIGALNGALMVTREYEKACEIWDTIEMGDVMSEGLNLTTTIEGMYNQREAIRPFLRKFKGFHHGLRLHFPHVSHAPHRKKAICGRLLLR